MLKRKKVREKGKLPLSRYFREFKTGDKVAVVRDLSHRVSFPKRIQGLTGMIKEKRGNAYVVELKEGRQLKQFTIAPLHLKKIKYIPK